MRRPPKPTKRQAQQIFNERIAEILARYEKFIAASKDHPTLTTYWRSGYTVSQHRVKGHWVVRAHANIKKGKK